VFETRANYARFKAAYVKYDEVKKATTFR